MLWWISPYRKGVWKYTYGSMSDSGEICGFLHGLVTLVFQMDLWPKFEFVCEFAFTSLDGFYMNNYDHVFR